MNGCVKETECTNCDHRMVCGIKENYLKLLENFQIPYDDGLFSVKIHCKHYSYVIGKNLISNILNTGTTKSSPLEY